ncbi:MAG TPA: phosphoribosylformylglycinamidine synthase subunit PurS [Acidimicrobiia bacterium]|jgi:phosphoribosylformylglycinamidine synthase subunit PurS|nr:phosphoribosylformylglycinamidine synthase subunit PurS [Acidimicrobiia bacterium]
MARFTVRIDVTHKPGILDPQGAQVERALPALGWSNVSQVEVGKSIHLVVEAESEAAARAQVDEMCARLLTNPVLEEYTAEIELAPAEEGAA